MDRIALHSVRVLECELCLHDGRDCLWCFCNLRSCRPAGSAHAEGLGAAWRSRWLFSLSNSLKYRDSAKTLASHLSMWIATSSSPFALPGLMAAIMSCMPLIGVVGLYLLESFLHASNPLNPLVCNIWRGSPLTKVPRMLKIPELRNLSSSDSDKASSISFSSFSAVSIKWYAASLAVLVADLNWNDQSRHACSPVKLSTLLWYFSLIPCA